MVHLLSTHFMIYLIKTDVFDWSGIVIFGHARMSRLFCLRWSFVYKFEIKFRNDEIAGVFLVSSVCSALPLLSSGMGSIDSKDYLGWVTFSVRLVDWLIRIISSIVFSYCCKYNIGFQFNWITGVIFLVSSVRIAMLLASSRMRSFNFKDNWGWVVAPKILLSFSAR